MPLPALTSRRARLPAVGLLFLLALLPQRFCLYGPPLHGAIMTLLSPLSTPLISLTSRIHDHAERPIPGAFDTENLSGEMRDRLEQIGEEMRSKDTRILVLEKRVLELERINAELQGLERRLGDSYVFRRAAVIGHGSDGSSQTLRINLGSGDGIRVGMAAVEGANLIGRIIQVSPTGSTLRPITAENNLIEVMITPPHIPPSGLPPERLRTCLIKPAGPRLLTADDLDRSMPVQVGDYARLDDDAGEPPWPQAVQGMIVGRVIRVEPDPDDPLRKHIEVRPLLSPYHIDALTVIVPRGIYNPGDTPGDNPDAPGGPPS